MVAVMRTKYGMQKSEYREASRAQVSLLYSRALLRGHRVTQNSLQTGHSAIV
jgi:hypothetical protein